MRALHGRRRQWSAFLALMVLKVAWAEVISKQDLYIELARQARAELAAKTQLSAHSAAAHFRSYIDRGFVKHGHPAEDMEELIRSWQRHNATSFGTQGLPFQQEFSRTVWLLWLGGWDSAPWVVREVAASYERHNPGWNIVRLDNVSFKDYVEIDYIDKSDVHEPAKSDILRISLLAEHGGVWADATVLCYAPLDSWIHEALIPQEMWMYHGRDEGKGPASWFIAAAKGSHLMHAWKHAVDEYWAERESMHDYFWMDALFKDLMEWDPQFLRQWQQVPYMYAGAEGQSSMLAWHMKTDDEDIKQILHRRPPYVLKLSYHGFPDEALESTQEMNGYYAILQSYRRRMVWHEMKTRASEVAPASLP